MKKETRSCALLAGAIAIVTGCESERPVTAPPVVPQMEKQPAEIIAVERKAALVDQELSAGEQETTPVQEATPIVASPSPPAEPLPATTPAPRVEVSRTTPSATPSPESEVSLPAGHPARLADAKSAAALGRSVDSLAQRSQSEAFTEEERKAIATAQEEIEKALASADTAPSQEAFAEALRQAEQTYKDLLNRLGSKAADPGVSE